MSEWSGYLWILGLVGFLVWWFWTASGPPPKDRERHTRPKDYMGRDL